ncbi:hypothetical protein TSUD_177740 [Trifolium subterraneum]|uniref:Uncharacterized protein n=1 Tax=Trifolium subterraneum TaxID=3900 RepID=A0A2Z6P2B2_TRISU|nr:hypothetical protein TSUD_177740 [Trifolium subterraneum]
MLQLGAATASNWGENVFQLMLFKTKHHSSSQDTVININNEFQKEDNSNPTKTIGNKAIKASVVVDTKNGEYVLKLTTVKTDSTTTAEQAKETAAILLSQAALLRQLGEKLLIQPEFFKSLDI